MNFKRVSVNSKLNEQFEFPNPQFEFGVWEDNFSELLSWQLNCHNHNYYEIGFLLDGELNYYINDECISLKKGEAIFVNSDTLHMAVDKNRDEDNPSILLVATFSSKVLVGENNYLYDKYFKEFEKRAISGIKLNPISNECKKIINKIKECLEINISDPQYELKVIQFLAQIWIFLNRCLKDNQQEIFYLTNEKKQQKEITVKKLLSYMFDHFEQKITIEDLCEAANISRSECFRSFKLFTRKKPLEYINELRLAEAYNLLINSEMNIKDISIDCGFGNSSYFIKQFKSEYGMTPLKFRQIERRKND